MRPDEVLLRKDDENPGNAFRDSAGHFPRAVGARAERTWSTSAPSFFVVQLSDQACGGVNGTLRFADHKSI